MMSQLVNLFQFYQKWVFEGKKLPQNTSKKLIDLSPFSFFFFFALRTKQNSSKEASVTYFQKMPI